MKIKIHTQILIAIVAGVITGLILKEKAIHIAFIGDMFIKLLKMIIVPLVLASMVAGVISVGDFRHLGRIGGKTFIYYMATTLLAVLVGLLLVNIIAPGEGFEIAGATDFDGENIEKPTVLSILTSIVPANIFKAMAEGKILSVIFFSLLLGTAISAVGEKAAPIAKFFTAFNAVMMKIAHWIMLLAPVGVFALMANMIGTMGLDVIGPVAKYVITVLTGLGIHAVITLPILLWVFGRYSPVRFIGDMFSAVATAFSTASSAATLPITMECLEKKTGVSNKVASFVLPLGATVNMDGTALYEAVAAMFIAQAYGIDLSIGHQVVIMLTATLASIGAAAIPSAGLVTMVIVLEAVGLPLEGLGVIWAVDRLVDMCRTAVNVWGDSCGAVVVAKLEGENLGQLPKS
jgi:Na+/H+-dicarboxylate symporter